MVVYPVNPYLIGRQQREVVRRVRDDVPLAARVTARARVAEPVQSDAQHAVRFERGHKQIAVLAGLAKLRQRSVVQGNLPDPASIRRKVKL